MSPRSAGWLAALHQACGDVRALPMFQNTRGHSHGAAVRGGEVQVDHSKVIGYHRGCAGLELAAGSA